jgi:hypothetical protein
MVMIPFAVVNVVVFCGVGKRTGSGHKGNALAFSCSLINVVM